MPSLEEIRETQRQTWNRFAPGWKKWDAFIMDWLRPIGDALLAGARLGPGAQVLDVATGTGEPGLTAARRAGRVIGTDLSEEMVGIARENARTQGLANYEARVMDATRTDFPDGTFDAVLCRHGVMFFPDIAAAAGEFARVLKPGGRLCLSCWSAPAGNSWATLALGVLGPLLSMPTPPAGAPGLFRCATPETLAGLFSRAGLTGVRETEAAGTVVFRSAEHYWEFLTDVVAPVAAALKQAGAPVQERAKRAVLDQAARHVRKEGLVLEWSARVAVGTKP